MSIWSRWEIPPASDPESGRSPMNSRTRGRSAAVAVLAPTWKVIELAQRGRLIVDVARADLEAAESRLGPFHPTTLHFRAALGEARNAWERLRAQYGTRLLNSAVFEPPVTTLALTTPDRPNGLILVPIQGRAYHVSPLPGTTPAPIQWRIVRLTFADEEEDEEGSREPYHACRLADRSTQCDCAEWAFRGEGVAELACKHLKALAALGWI